MGNLRSVFNAFEALGIEAAGVVLPGVGAFGDRIRNLFKLRDNGFAYPGDPNSQRGDVT